MQKCWIARGSEQGLFLRGVEGWLLGCGVRIGRIVCDTLSDVIRRVNKVDVIYTAWGNNRPIFFCFAYSLFMHRPVKGKCDVRNREF